MVLSPYRFAPSGGWLTTATLAQTSNSAGWGGYTARIIIPTTAIAAGSRVRLTLRAATTGANLVISAAYLGVKAASGDPYDFAATPTQVLFAGSGTKTINVGTTAITDDVVMAVSGTSALILSAQFSSGDMSVATAPTWSKHDKNALDAATVNATGYSAAVGAGYLVSKVEIFQP